MAESMKITVDFVAKKEGKVLIMGGLEYGTITVGDEVKILSIIGDTKHSVVNYLAIDKKKNIDTATTGDYIVISLDNVNEGDISKGCVITDPLSDYDFFA